MKKSRIGIINVTGYAGIELARLLYQHPEVELTSVTGRSAAGQKLGKVFPQAKAEYKACKKHELGDVQFVDCGDVVVANMVAQRGIYPRKDGTKKGCMPLRYCALFAAMKKVASWTKKKDNVSIHAPKFACGLAGGEWEIVELFIKELWAKDIDVYIYTPPATDDSKNDGNEPAKDDR